MDSIDFNDQNTNLYLSLPIEVAPTQSRQQVLKIIFSTLILFVLFNMLYLRLITQYDDTTGNTRKWFLLDSLDKPVDVIILGDSVSNSGIIPAVIEEQTGKTAVNLALTVSWTFYHDMWMLERYIEKFGPPSAIIWGHVFDKSYRKFKPAHYLSSSSTPYGSPWVSSYLPLKLDQNDNLEIMAAHTFPLYYRDLTSKLIFTSLLTGQNPMDDVSFLVDNMGYKAYDTLDVETVDKKADSKWIQTEYNVTGDSRKAIEAFLQIVDKYQIPTYTFNTVVNKLFGEKDKFLPAMQSQQDFWNDLAAKHPTLFYNPEIPMFESQFMVNADHLNISGAEIYTKYLVDWIWGDYEAPTLAEIRAKS